MTFSLVPRRAPLLRRLRIVTLDDPKPALIVTDSPDRHCPQCHGDGGWLGGYHWNAWAPCGCWNPDWQIRLMPLPRRLAERRHPLDRRSRR